MVICRTPKLSITYALQINVDLRSASERAPSCRGMFRPECNPESPQRHTVITSPPLFGSFNHSEGINNLCDLLDLGLVT